MEWRQKWVVLRVSQRQGNSDCLFMFLGNTINWDQENHRFQCNTTPAIFNQRSHEKCSPDPVG